MNDAEKQLKKYKQDNEILSKGAESLREELNKTLKERDIALKEGDNLSKQLHDSERALSEEKTYVQTIEFNLIINLCALAV